MHLVLHLLATTRVTYCFSSLCLKQNPSDRSSGVIILFPFDIIKNVMSIQLTVFPNSTITVLAQRLFKKGPIV